MLYIVESAIVERGVGTCCELGRVKKAVLADGETDRQKIVPVFFPERELKAAE